MSFNRTGKVMVVKRIIKGIMPALLPVVASGYSAQLYGVNFEAAAGSHVWVVAGSSAGS